MAGPSIPSFRNFFRSIFPRLPEFSPDYARAVANQITLNPHDLFTLTQELAIDAAPFSEKLGQDCLGVDYKQLCGKDGKVSQKKIEELRDLCHNLKNCVDERLKNCKQNFSDYLMQYQSGRPMSFMEDANGITIVEREKRYPTLKEDATLNEQYRYFLERLKEKMPHGPVRFLKDIFRIKHEGAVGLLYDKADHLFESEQMERYWERAARHYEKAVVEQTAGNPNEYIEAVLKDSDNVKKLEEAIRNIDYMLDHFYLPAARIREPSSKTIVDRLHEINRSTTFQVSENELKSVESTLKGFQKWRNDYPVLGKSAVFNHLVDRYIKAALHAARQRKQGGIQITDYCQRYYAQKLWELAAIAASYYPQASAGAPSAALSSEQEKACLKALYKHAKRTSGELMRQSKSDAAIINTANHGFQVAKDKAASNRTMLAALDAKNSYKAYIPSWLWTVYEKVPDEKRSQCAKEMQAEADAMENSLPGAFRPFLRSIHVNHQQAETLLTNGLAYGVKGLELGFSGLLKAIGAPFLLINKLVIETPAYMSVWADGVVDDNGTIRNVPATFREAGLNSREEVAKKFQSKMKGVEGFYRMISLLFQYYRMSTKLQGNIIEYNGGESPDDSKLILLNYCAYNVTGLLLQPALRRTYIDKALNSAIDYISTGIKNGNKPNSNTLENLMANVLFSSAMDVARNVCDADDRTRECGQTDNKISLLRLLCRNDDALFHRLLNEGRLLSKTQVEKVCQCFCAALKQDPETGMIRFKKEAVKSQHSLSVEEFMRGVIATCFLDGKNQSDDKINTLAQKVENVKVNDCLVKKAVTVGQQDGTQKIDFIGYCEKKLVELKEQYNGKEEDPAALLEYHTKRIDIAQLAKQHELYNLQHHSGKKDLDREKQLQRDLDELLKEKRQLFIMRSHINENNVSGKTAFSPDVLAGEKKPPNNRNNLTPSTSYQSGYSTYVSTSTK